MATVTAIKTSLQKHLPSPKNNFVWETRTWATPRIVAIGVGLEINAYACAELN